MHAALLTTVCALVLFSLLVRIYACVPCAHTGGVVKDQAEADEGTSLKERVGMAAGKDVWLIVQNCD